MKYFYDTEFLEDGKTVQLISIGVVAEDGREYFAHVDGYDEEAAICHEFVGKFVLPQVLDTPKTSRERVRRELAQFLLAGRGEIELWGWFAAWDHMALSQLWGTFMDQPDWLPMRTNDVAQLAQDRNVRSFPYQESVQHDALNDARWTRQVHSHVIAYTYR